MTSEDELAELVPSLLEIPGCGGLTAAKLVGEAADITRFKSRDAYAMWAEVAPIPLWSTNDTDSTGEATDRPTLQSPG